MRLMPAGNQNRHLRRLGFVLFLLSLESVSSVVGAQRAEFGPYMALQYNYVSNLNFATEPGMSDSSLRFLVVLPVDKTGRKSDLGFEYSGYVERFDEVDALDNISHRLTFDVSSRPSRRVVLGAGATYLRTQDQGGPLLDGYQEEFDVDPTFTRRIGSEAILATAGLSLAFSERWGSTLSIDAAIWSFSDPDESGLDDPIPELRDRDEYRAMLGFLWKASPTMSVGPNLGYRRFDLAVGGITEEFFATMTFVSRITQISPFAIS